MNSLRFILAAAFLVTPQYVFAQTPTARNHGSDCQVRIDTSASNWVIRGFDLLGGDSPSATFDLTFSNDGGGDCVLYPVFMLDQEPLGLQKGNGRRIPYTLLDMFSDTNATPLAGRTLHRVTQRAVAVPPGGQQVVRYQFNVADAAIDGDGLFSQHVSIEAQGVDGRSLATRQLVLGIDVLPSAALGLSGAFQLNNGHALVDLGELQQGPAQVPLHLRVQATRRYTLTFDSQNNGQLRMAGTEWSVPYNVLVDGRLIRLGAGRDFYRANDGTGLRRDSLPLAFLIGDVSGRRAGTYTDVISISVAPQ